MQFNSIQYLVFLLIAVIVYFAVPSKLRQPWLLAASYFFYMNWNAKYALLLFFSTFSTWVFALLIAKHQPHRKVFLTLCIIINLALLFYFKYFNFLVGSAMHLLRRSFDPWDIVLPVGISFYTLQALGYSIDELHPLCSVRLLLPAARSRTDRALRKHAAPDPRSAHAVPTRPHPG